MKYGQVHPHDMKLACNIDRRGRLARALPGAALVVLALGWYLFDPSAALGWHAVQLILGLAGGFMVFEGTAGWCALRALGMRLPL